MAFACGRRILYSSLVVILIISVLQIWVCCDCKAGAIRIFPGNAMAKMTESTTMKNNKGKEALLHKYFNGRSSGLNRTGKGFQQSKRRVPSCPDPLHNK